MFLSHSAFAFFGGTLLGLVIFFSGQVAQATTPLLASYVLHVLGAFCSIVFVLLFFMSPWASPRRSPRFFNPLLPIWAYLPGLPGSIAAILFSFTATTVIGLSGTLCMSLLGQILMGLSVDRFGWFGMKRRSLDRFDFFKVVLIFSGSIVLIFLAR